MLYKDAAGTLEVAEGGGKVCGYTSTFDRERDAYAWKWLISCTVLPFG